MAKNLLLQWNLQIVVVEITLNSMQTTPCIHWHDNVYIDVLITECQYAF